MNAAIKFLVSAVALALISGCATHNTPDSAKPNFSSEKNKYEVFVDQDGTFYPENWEKTYGKPCRLKCKGQSYSLRRAAGKSGLAQLEQAEEKTVEDISRFLNNKKRVFILVHGFNNSEKVANQAFEKIESKIKFNESDAVVWYHWDGLVGKGIGSASIWFKSTGYSQLAGERGLRDILNSVSGKEIIFIAHSRGASVVLSALSNPPYDDDFENATDWVDINGNESLKAQDNTIRAIFLAAAIGDIDFKTPDLFGYRDFSKQLKGIVYSVNPNDPVLSKWFLKSNDLNPTDLGLKKSVGKKLNEHYGNMTPIMVCDLDKHGFPKYVENDTFKEMLIASGVGVKE